MRYDFFVLIMQMLIIFVPSQMLANCNYAITLGKQMGFSLVGISGGADLGSGDGGDGDEDDDH